MGQAAGDVRGIGRRRVLGDVARVAAGTALATLLPPGPESLAAENPFRHGVASGDPHHDSVVLWTRVDGVRGDVTLRWEVATDLAFRDVVASGTATAPAARDHTVRVVADGLAGFTTHWYRFAVEVGGITWRSLVGRTKTAPAPGQDPGRLRFGVTSCANLAGGKVFNAYRLLARRDLDAVFALGDYFYEYGANDVEPIHETYRLEDYRTRHAFYKRNADLQRAHQLHPWICIWDDHESSNNTWFGGANNHSRDGSDVNDQPNPDAGDLEPVDEGDWFQRKAWAQQAYDEWMPMRSTDPAVIYRRLAYGDLLDVLMVDTRLEGRDLQAVAQTSGGEQGSFDASINDPDRQMYSPAQRDWLLANLSASTATWRLIGNQVMMSQLKFTNAIPETLRQQLPDAFQGIDGVGSGGIISAPDLWDGYNAERNRLYDHIKAEGIENVVVITGDIHSSWANDLYTDPVVDQPIHVAGIEDRHVGVEFITPGITSGGFPPEAAPAFEADFRANNPNLRWMELTRNGYLVLDVDADRVQADWWFVATIDAVSDDEEYGASWATSTAANRLAEASAPTQDRPGAPGTPPEQPEPAEVPGPAAPSPSTAAPLPVTGGGLAVGAAAVLGAVALRRRAARAQD